jgi:glycosyltransferase involved in cell wall biosynthesis
MSKEAYGMNTDESTFVNNSMRILIVSQYFWPEDFRVNELVTGLAARGHEVTVLTSWPNYPEGRFFPDYVANRERYARFQGVEIVRIPQVARGKRRFQLLLNYLSFAIMGAVLGPFRLRGRNFDVVFVFQTSPVTVGIPGGIIAWLKRAPMIMWILDCWPESLKAVGIATGPAPQWAVGLLVRAIYSSADLLLGQSEGFISNVVRYASAEKFRHFPNWVERVYAEADVAPSVSLPQAPEGTFSVCYAGNVGEAQDFPAVLDAMDRLRDAPIRFLVVGDGRDLDRSRNAAEAMGLASKVLFLGRHPPEAMPGFFAAADALLVSLKPDPIFSMTVPGKIQTYLAAGRPIVAMLDGEGADVIRTSGAGIAVAAGDSAGLAEAIKTLAALPPDARQSMGLAGRAFAKRHYDFDTQMDRLETWLTESIADSTGSSKSS